MRALFAEQRIGQHAVFRNQFVAIKRAVFGEQRIGSHCVFRDQFTAGYLPVVPDVRGVFADQRFGARAILREQYRSGSGSIPGVSKIALWMVSSGKVRLVNGRLLLSQYKT